jgi:nucleotide-binding universal stress UspA family protein
MGRRILVPYDGSLHAQCALVEASVRAEDSAAQVTLLTVVPDHPYPDDLPAEVALEAEADEYRRIAARLAQASAELAPQTTVETLIRRGRPADEIVSAISRGHHDLVVMGSRSRGRFHSMREGSVAREVRRRSAVPVVLTPAVPYRDRRPFGRRLHLVG